jgi:hypothetical protein
MFTICPSIDPSFSDDRLKNIVQYYSISPAEMEKELHIYAAELLNTGKVSGCVADPVIGRKLSGCRMKCLLLC